jgi:hypothetical protein
LDAGHGFVASIDASEGVLKWQMRLDFKEMSPLVVNFVLVHCI